MKFPIYFSLAQNAEKSARFNWTWGATDRLFKILQWVVFLAFLRYAADKSHSSILDIIEFMLEIILSWLVWLMIEAKYEIRVHGVNDSSKLHREVFFFSSTLFLAVTVPAIHVAITHLVNIIIKATHP